MHDDERFYKIRAAILRPGAESFRIGPVKIDSPRDDEVLVRIVSAGICHTDIDFINGFDGEPVILGHEGAGIAEVVGKNVKGIKQGDHVVLSYQSCGLCLPCRRGRPTGCTHFYDLNFGFARLDGSSAYEQSGVRGHFFGQSSFATYALATGRNIVKVSPDLDLFLLAPLGCGLQTGAGTVMNSLKVAKGASIAVFGTGSVGLAAIMAARIVGADPIIGVDKNPRRLELALQLGATHVVDSRSEEGAFNLARQGVDYVLEITGDPKMNRLAVQTLKPKGILALIAEPDGSARLPGGRKVMSIIQGDAVPQVFIPKLIALYQEGRFPFDRLVTFYNFKEMNRAVVDSVRGDTIKPVLRISEV